MVVKYAVSADCSISYSITFCLFQTETKRGVSRSPERNESEKKKMAKTSHTELEFGGAIGAFIMMFFLPTTVYYINMACAKVCWDNLWSSLLMFPFQSTSE